ncbi:hypothetical protein CTI12_AA514050 [Artemisia annua]|uniref:Uncharacterized protein n=1 Tax=Artemisia annua TaxID=35608 RepID=A0A2U1KZH4_ARTAN|nr:hypothetical protein CTI12_AA514050 [Artemisia annua]
MVFPRTQECPHHGPYREDNVSTRTQVCHGPQLAHSRFSKPPLVFRSLCKKSGKETIIRLGLPEMKKVIWYVLHNSPEIDAYMNEFESERPESDMQQEFPRWFESKIGNLYTANDPRCTPDLFALACGPSSTATSVNSCIVNGVKFVVHSRDVKRTTQNSGICSPGEKEGEMYYGQLEGILEFSCTQFKVVLFRVKCGASSSSQNEAINALTQQIQKLGKQIATMQKPVNVVQEVCNECGGAHRTRECKGQGYLNQEEDVNAFLGEFQDMGQGRGNSSSNQNRSNYQNQQQNYQNQQQNLLYQNQSQNRQFQPQQQSYNPNQNQNRNQYQSNYQNNQSQNYPNNQNYQDPQNYQQHQQVPYPQNSQSQPTPTNDPLMAMMTKFCDNQQAKNNQVDSTLQNQQATLKDFQGIENLAEEVIEQSVGEGAIRPSVSSAYSGMVESPIWTETVRSTIRPYGFSPEGRMPNSTLDHTPNHHIISPNHNFRRAYPPSTETGQASTFSIRPSALLPYGRMPYFIEENEVIEQSVGEGVIRPSVSSAYSGMVESPIWTETVRSTIRRYGFSPEGRMPNSTLDHTPNHQIIRPNHNFRRAYAPSTETGQASTFSIRPSALPPYGRMPYFIEENGIESMDPFYFDMGGDDLFESYHFELGNDEL